MHACHRRKPWICISRDVADRVCLAAFLAQHTGAVPSTALNANASRQHICVSPHASMKFWHMWFKAAIITGALSQIMLHSKLPRQDGKLNAAGLLAQCEATDGWRHIIYSRVQRLLAVVAFRSNAVLALQQNLLGAGCKPVEGAGGTAAAGSGGAGGRRAVAAAPPAHAVPARLLHIQSPCTVSCAGCPCR